MSLFVRVGFKIYWLSVLCLTTLACTPSIDATKTIDQTLSAKAGVTEVKTISRKLLFATPTKHSVLISPNGKWLSWMGTKEGVDNVYIAPIDTPLQVEQISFETDSIDGYEWASDSEHLLLSKDQQGDENYQIHRLNILTKSSVNLTPEANVAAFVHSTSKKHPDKFVLSINDRDPAWHDLYVVTVATGARELLFKNEQYSRVLVDDDFRVRLVSVSLADGSEEWRHVREQAVAELFSHVPMEDALSTAVAGFIEDNNHVLWWDSRNRDLSALVKQSLISGKTEILFESHKGDVETYLMAPQKKAIRAVSVNHAQSTWTVLDESLRVDFDYLTKLAEGEFWFDAQSRDDRYWVITATSSNRSDRTYLYDRSKQSATLLFKDKPELDLQPLSIMEPVEIPSRDGLTLVSYLTRPLMASVTHESTPAKPVPLVLLVHGGPWTRDFWGYNAEHQWLANRGYAVLSVNFRGSNGFGKNFLNAGNREWAGKMQDDLNDAVDWAVAKGIADPDRLAILGASYGGYAALVALSFTPEKFQCAVDIVGPSNLETLLTLAPEYWQEFDPQWNARVGDVDSEEGRAFLASRSPLHKADAIKRPLLVIQGANDVRVTPIEAEQIVHALKAKQRPVSYLLFPDEGHGIFRDENSLAMYAATEEFLSRCLGGRYESDASDFVRTSMQVKAGEEHLPNTTRLLREEKMAKNQAAPKHIALPEPAS